ncbi:MAG: MFS transporter [Acutalibacteraceae bacterium]
MKIVEKAKGAVSSVKTHWKTPPEGRYIPYKEIMSYSVGGIGVKFLISVVYYIGLSGTNLLAGSALGLKNDDLVNLSLIATVLNLVIVPLRGMIIDNTRSKKGKFRPYLVYAGIPTALLTTGFALLPFESMSYNQRLWSLFAVYILLQLCYPFYDQAYTTLVQVMSPNSTERADVITISTFIYSLAPSITGLFVPIIAGFTGGLEHINAYRIIMPAFGIFGVILGFLSYSGTQERIIVSKDYTPKVPFFKGIMSGVKNKYTWSRTISSWFVFFQMGIGNVTTWYFYYGIKDMLNLTTEKQGVLNGTLMTILGMAATPAMFLAPIIIRKIGKKNLVIFYTVCNIFSMIGMFLSIKNIWLLFVFTWLRAFFCTFPLISDNAINADILDYQQYKTGERLEGLLGQVVSFIGTFVTMGITYFIQTVVITKHFGLTDNYDDLYNAAYREPMAKAMILITIVGYVLSLIPLLTMYDLTEEDHEAHIAVLKIRAALEDYATDSLSEGQLENAREIYAKAITEYNDCLKKAETATGKEKRKLKRLIKANKLVIDEKDRFNQPDMKNKTEKAKQLLSKTTEELYGISEPSMEKYDAANAMPESTKEQIKAKNAALKEASKELDNFHKKAYDYIQARKLIKQYEYYSNWNSLFEVSSMPSND